MTKGNDTIPGLSPALFWCDGNVSSDLSIYHDEDVRQHALISSVASGCPYTLQRTPLNKLLVAHKKKKADKEFHSMKNFHDSMKGTFSSSFPHRFSKQLQMHSFAKSQSDLLSNRAAEYNIVAVILQCLK
eukprot:752954-Hanusia_phi.AAC.1